MKGVCAECFRAVKVGKSIQGKLKTGTVKFVFCSEKCNKNFHSRAKYQRKSKDESWMENKRLISRKWYYGHHEEMKEYQKRKQKEYKLKRAGKK